MKRRIFLAALMALASMVAANGAEREPQKQYWNITPSGGIKWIPKAGERHYDHIEMSGKRVSSVLRYGVDENGRFSMERGMVWPLLRTVPNNTHASLMRRLGWNPLDAITLRRVPVSAMHQTTDSVVLSMGCTGAMHVYTVMPDNGLRIERIFFPSIDKPVLIEQCRIMNTGKKDVTLDVADWRSEIATDADKGVYGTYIMEMYILNPGVYKLSPGKSVDLTVLTAARLKDSEPLVVDAAAEAYARAGLASELASNLVLNTPDSIINTMFGFSKLRACESIYETKAGPLHGPGGESYYAAIWANDQAEYANPFFPFTGYDYANKSAEASFRLFADYMNDDYKPIPSSIIAEGLDFWNGAGDRGDAAMIAYGASRYALAKGDRATAEQLWPLIQWTLEYCKRKLNAEGVVESDSDELEGRFPAGDANLCTSSLYYDALLSAAYIAADLKMKPSVAASYRKEAKELRAAILKYFRADVEGFHTYAYYKGNDKLRSWICIPLTVSIDDDKEGTIDALFSPKLRTEDGLLTQSGSTTFWDRSTLYALRGALAAQEADRAMEFIKDYSAKRLLGSHVPYAIEAWPEGSQRHLSAESALYARIFTEGLFGIRPVGLRSFSLRPAMPSGWNEMELKKIRAFGTEFSIRIERKGSKLCATINSKSLRKPIVKTFVPGSSVVIKL